MVLFHLKDHSEVTRQSADCSSPSTWLHASSPGWRSTLTDRCEAAIPTVLYVDLLLSTAGNFYPPKRVVQVTELEVRMVLDAHAHHGPKKAAWFYMREAAYVEVRRAPPCC